MDFDGIEKKILEKLSKNLVMRKEEILEFLGEEVSNPKEIFKMVMSDLIQRGLVKYVYAGATCYAITQKGMREI